ncbi:hypothetical protein [Halalkalicoccus salilacus]|uniref:hypothetical protein n=1 Tax=Halalkalicoccus TaxID=332246 RepID=UPI002F96E5AA
MSHVRAQGERLGGARRHSYLPVRRDGVEIRHYLDDVDGLELLFDTAHYYPYDDNYPAGT